MTRERRQQPWRFRDWSELLASLVAIMLMVVGGWLLHLQGADLQREARQVGSQHTQLVDACERLQIVRVNDNASHYADWLVFRAVLAETEMRDPRAPFLPQLRAAVRAKEWVPLTDCRRAVATEGSHYRPPRPISFQSRQPPLSALELPDSAYR